MLITVNNALVGTSESIQKVRDAIERVAHTTTPILLVGETGTGKESIAREIHELSNFSQGSFVTVNCPALTDTDLQQGLLLHSPPHGIKRGYQSLRHVNNATVFLNEIGELPLSAQGVLLEVLQKWDTHRLENEKHTYTTRFIASTSRNLAECVKIGEFRKDLFYRINVFTITLPLLRERIPDIILLVDHLLNAYKIRYSKHIETISSEALELLTLYPWPGNVRELENVIEHAVLVSADTVIEAHDLPSWMQVSSTEDHSHGDTFKSLIAAYEKKIITNALETARGNQTEAARLLGTTKRVIQYKVRLYHIDYRKFRNSQPF